MVRGMGGWQGLRAILLLGIGIAGAGCQRPPAPRGPVATDWTPRPAPDLGLEVARVAGRPIHAAEVGAQAARTGTSAAQALADLVDFELLAERARGHAATLPADDPELRRLRVQRLIETEFEPTIDRDDMPDAELHKLYVRNETKFVHPRLVEVALLSVYTGPGMKPGPRAEKEKLARELWAAFSKAPPRTPEEFEDLSKQASFTGRVTHWKILQGPDRRYGPFAEGMGKKLGALTKIGEHSGLITDDSGFHIARLLGERPAKNVSFAEARAEILTKAYEPWRRQRFLEWTAKLGVARGVQIFTERAMAVTGESPR